MNYQYRKTRKKYNGRKRSDICVFCDDEPTKGNIVRETKHAYIVPNLTSYDIWELHDVTEHLLLIPRRHVESLNELHKDELEDVMKLLAEYEGAGYNIYARANGSKRKSIPHQHTHLIKIDYKKEPHVSFFLRKPWLLIKF